MTKLIILQMEKNISTLEKQPTKTLMVFDLYPVIKTPTKKIVNIKKLRNLEKLFLSSFEKIKPKRINI